MKMQFRVSFKQGQKTVASVDGRQEVEAANLTVQDVVEKVHETEAFLEKLTGYRVHIEMMN